MDYEREQEQAAADEAAEIGGRRDDRLDYIEADDVPPGVDPEAWRVVQEGGGGVAEGYEEAEAALIERAENPHGPSPLKDAEGVDEEALALEQVDGEADGLHVSNEDPADTER